MMLEKSGSMRSAYGDALIELGAENPRVVVLGADTTDSIKSANFGIKYPERFFNMGIAEQNLIGVASGFAFAGKIVYAGTYAIFVPGKCVDQIRNIVAYANLDVKIVCSHGGVSVGPDGGSHQQMEDIAIMRAIPRMRVVVPADAIATKVIIKAVADIPGPFYVRISRGISGANSAIVYDDGMEYHLGNGNVLREGKDAVIFACGLLVPEALKAADSLQKRGVSVAVIDIHTVKPIDEKLITRYGKSCGFAVTAEEHNIFGGLGSAVAEVLSDGYPIPVKRVGVMDTFGESGEAAELMTKYGLTADKIEQAVFASRAEKR